MKCGDVLPIIGGPLDGDEKRVDTLFPWAPDFLPGGFVLGDHKYELRDGAWRYVGKRVPTAPDPPQCGPGE